MPFYQTSTWVCPANVTSVTVECWGGGAGGGTNGSGGGGGGGGGYSKMNTVSVTPGTSYTVTVGVGGGSVVSGGDSWFSSTSTVIAKGGTTGSGTAGGAGGAAGSGIGDITTSGGTGGTGAGGVGGGGGGGAGDKTAGGNGSGQVAGPGGATTGGIGATGGNNGFNGNPGRAPGGGGGGDGGTATAGGGAGGMVQLTYTTLTLPITGSSEIDPDSNKNYQNLAVDDGDYFVQYGSEYITQEYKEKWTNNTDTPSFTWKGRTTYDTSVSPFLIQIYNQNSATWETLANINTQPADTDFQYTVTQSASVSNYYDSNNIVTFRVYQKVI